MVDKNATVLGLLLIFFIPNTILKSVQPNQSQPVVNTSQGKIQGVEDVNLNGEKIYAFYGIPYARAPVADLRFKEPQEAESWKGIRDCSHPGNDCPKKLFITKEGTGFEDCLYLNVYTKYRAETTDQTIALQPVMVWIHSGGFIMGSGHPRYSSPKAILTQEVILVTINYRLGILGFLQSKDQQNTIKGNMGLKDQVMALNWVKKNIAAFKGNPDDVTIFGDSAGAASVHYHILSPLSRGLFHKAILQSGVALNPWADAGLEFNDHQAMDFTPESVKSENEAIQFLQNATLDEIMNAQVRFLSTTQSGMISPTVEKPSNSAFLTQTPIEIIFSGNFTKVPMIVGYNSMEGLMRIAGNKSWRLNFNKVIPYKVGNIKKYKEIVETLEKLYFRNTNRQEGEIACQGDYDFLFGIFTSIKIHYFHSPIFLYKMTLDSSLNSFKHKFGLINYSGAAHTDEQGYLFAKELPTPGSLEELSVNRFIKLWTNFAKHGNPTPNKDELGVVWDPVKDANFNTFEIGATLGMLSPNPGLTRVRHWVDIYKDHPLKVTLFGGTREYLQVKK